MDLQLKARKKLESKLKTIYTGIITGRTNVNISVGVPRAIRVNIIGQVNLPGTYTFSAFNTVYNAIYVAGGITEKASLRNIKVFRNNKLVDVVDVYKFLTNGDGSSNIRLENNDLILVGPYTNRVQLLGEVKLPGIFETKEGESLMDLINYSGGFTEKAFKKSIKLTRVIENNLSVIDISYDQLPFFTRLWEMFSRLIKYQKYIKIELSSKELSIDQVNFLFLKTKLYFL